MSHCIWNLTRFVAVATLLAGLAIAHPIQAATRVVVLSGDAAPDGNGFFAGRRFVFSSSVLNDAGQVAFYASLGGTSGGSTDDTGIFRGDGLTLSQIVRAGQAAPGGNDDFSSFSNSSSFPSIVLNDAGQVAFFSRLTATSSGVDPDRGIFLGDGATLSQIVRNGQATPEGTGSFTTFSNPVLNNVGEVAFQGSVFVNTSILRSDETTLTQIARKGQTVPDGNGTFSFLGDPALNNMGQVASIALLTGTSGAPTDDTGIFRGDGTTLTQIVRKGQTAPDGNGSFALFNSLLGSPALNDAGQVAFLSSLNDTTGGTADNTGIFRGDGTTLVQLARTGQPAPGGNGNFSILQFPALNNLGQAAFLANLTNTSGGLFDNSGIFLGDGTSLTQIARAGQATPGGNGNFFSFGDPAMNDAGQVVFSASSIGSTINGGIYLHDDSLGLIPLAQVGDPFLGSTISQVGFSSGGHFGDEQSGLNERGQVAYTFSLLDGRSGIALWSPIPEPSSEVLLYLSAMALSIRRLKR
ncbi:DUF7453 family protein [Bythopirellula polymerisocia]|uniref:PEP-CTERM protein-sorting domain-containing protein n=1 Tax=Bythopirellula polymerisocia TaxID=2528003 RepID=A0A5C6CDT9_9BACT|nr:choice-of-anchor tandem repeat NxxGxxAF-containing protein [Bythopirellula polymerisocia]TWU22760.1 hypothetical protein Pla144_42210 [Bythopirellula polymerisocia]